MKIQIREIVWMWAALLAIVRKARPRAGCRGHCYNTRGVYVCEPLSSAIFLGCSRGQDIFPARLGARLRGLCHCAASQRARLGPLPGPVSAAVGANSTCNAYARYLLSGYLEIQPFGKTFARHVFVFFTPTFSFGNNVPQFKYTASMAPIAFERAVGIGIELPKNFEFRVTQHQVDWLGRYGKNVGPADLGTSGPYGLYTTIGARWYFGGYGRSREGR